MTLIEQINILSIFIGVGLTLGLVFIIFSISKLFKKEKPKTKTTLPTLKTYVKEAHSNLVESANNLIKLHQVFNEIEDESK